MKRIFFLLLLLSSLFLSACYVEPAYQQRRHKYYRAYVNPHAPRYGRLVMPRLSESDSPHYNAGRIMGY